MSVAKFVQSLSSCTDDIINTLILPPCSTPQRVCNKTDVYPINVTGERCLGIHCCVVCWVTSLSSYSFPPRLFPPTGVRDPQNMINYPPTLTQSDPTQSMQHKSGTQSCL